MARRRTTARSTVGSPFLTDVGLHADRVEHGAFPFTLPVLSRGLDLRFDSPVTFFVGENGSGKSTLLEALAWSVGFGAQGGNRDHRYAWDDDGRTLGRALKLSWRQKVADGFFMRAETFFNFATRLEAFGSSYRAYGGAPLNQRSHGDRPQPIEYRDTEHYTITRDFLNAPERFFRYLLEPNETEEA